MCPSCLSENIRVEAFDFGTDTETGYRDRGAIVRCMDCGAQHDSEDWDCFMQAEIAKETAALAAEEPECAEIPVLEPVALQVHYPDIPEWRNR